MKITSNVLNLILLGGGSFTAPVFAHTGLGETHSFMEGFVHPWLGVDHILVMVAVGLWACTFGGKMVWQLPSSFLAFMAVGASLHFSEFYLQGAEQWVAISVVAFGLILWHNWRTSTTLATLIVSIFAIGHGYVHALELAQSDQALSYALGFLLATTLLHGVGVWAGLMAKPIVKRLHISLGIISTLVGVLLLAG